jgi:hypothetical protein
MEVQFLVGVMGGRSSLAKIQISDAAREALVLKRQLILDEISEMIISAGERLNKSRQIQMNWSN